MKLSEFQYDLPESAIAQEPMDPRDHSRLLVLHSETGAMDHRQFFDLPNYLQAGDVLVLNVTRVFPARLRGRKVTGGKIEILLTGIQNPQDARAWTALVRGTSQASSLIFPGGLTATMEERLNEGEWRLRFSSDSVRDYLEEHGEMPLPPYIKRPTKRASDLERYQTVYADMEGAVAAPTAGFHFTPRLLKTIEEKGVQVVHVLLHVGWGTFRPIRAESVEEHAMLPEAYEVSLDTAHALNHARREKRRIIAVGTTVVRTLETICDEHGDFKARKGWTNLYIYPGYRFKAVDALVTNFHLPDSTPLLLACAFHSHQSGRSAPAFSLKPVYEEAIREKYRFYSYGDAMFIQ